MTTLLVASTGGHLSELHALAPRMGLEPPLRWVTFETPQSTALLAGEDVTWVRYTGQRDYSGIARNLAGADRLLRAGPSAVVSTGAAIALSFMPLARARRVPCHYVEGIARTEGPSVTGRVLERAPGVRLYTQWEDWADERWRYRGSVFGSFTTDPPADDVELRRVVVMLGTMRYSFRRLVDRLVAILPPEAEVTWQVGETPVDDLPIEGHRALTPAELDRVIAAADVVVGHAGGGSALQVMEAGKCPVLVPREAAHGEHVDDHQLEIAARLPDLGLAVGARVEDLTLEHLRAAAARRVRKVGDPPAFALD